VSRIRLAHRPTDPLQDRVEFGVADVERKMTALKRFYVVVEEQRESFVDTHRREVAILTLESKPKSCAKKRAEASLSPRGNDCVAEHDRHRPPLAVSERPFVDRFGLIFLSSEIPKHRRLGWPGTEEVSERVRKVLRLTSGLRGSVDTAPAYVCAGSLARGRLTGLGPLDLRVRLRSLRSTFSLCSSCLWTFGIRGDGRFGQSAQWSWRSAHFVRGTSRCLLARGARCDGCLDRGARRAYLG